MAKLKMLGPKKIKLTDLHCNGFTVSPFVNSKYLFIK